MRVGMEISTGSEWKRKRLYVTEEATDPYLWETIRNVLQSGISTNIEIDPALTRYAWRRRLDPLRPKDR